MSRQDLFNVIKVKNLRSFTEIMKAIGVNGSPIGCEICKPAVASVLSSLYNEHVMKPAHHQNEDTNDRFMVNMQRNGTFSVVPRIPAGEISPDSLISIGKVAKKYGLYTKVRFYLVFPDQRKSPSKKVGPHSPEETFVEDLIPYGGSGLRCD
ncbi:Nitrite reductase [NAD(P)H] [Termitomyces sp. T32_za158]|nr:Nitrite reductase [NAD(P)H] [Termitomyces sp. T32_za158]